MLDPEAAVGVFACVKHVNQQLPARMGEVQFSISVIEGSTIRQVSTEVRES